MSSKNEQSRGNPHKPISKKSQKTMWQEGQLKKLVMKTRGKGDVLKGRYTKGKYLTRRDNFYDDDPQGKFKADPV